MTYPVRALTSGEQTLLRSDGQAVDLRMAVFTPTVVFQALVNQVTIDNSSIVQIGYDTVASGSYTAIQPGMDLYVGSSAGASDYGITRIRKAADGNYIYFGETSDIPFVDNAYLTVVKHYGLWAKYNRSVGATWYMDWDIPFTNQYDTTDPVPVLGPSMAVLKIPASGSATLTMPNSAVNSWVPDGSTITAHSWSCAGASISGSTSGSPILTFTNPGSYVIDCTVTASNGKTNTGHRYAFVWDDSHLPTNGFRVDSLTGDQQQGGWIAQATMYDQATQALIKDRALISIFAIDYFNASGSVIGQIPGYENIVFTGYVDGQSIEYNGELGTLQFTCRGAGPWLDNVHNWPISITDMHIGNLNWTHKEPMTTDFVMWALCHWCSTVDSVIDVYPCGDARYSSGNDVQAGSLLYQLKQIGYQVFAAPTSDRFNRLFFSVDCQLLPLANRSSIPTIQTITKNDWTGDVNITRMAQTPVSILDVSGYVFNTAISGSSVQPSDYGFPVYSRHPGFAPHQYGKPQPKDRLCFSSQTDANNVCGLLGGKLNNEFPNTTIQLAQNNRMIDIAPPQYAVVNMDAADNPRGITWSNKRFIPIRVTHKHDPQKGMFTTDLQLEAETFQQSSTTITAPVVTYPGLGDFSISDIGTFPMNFTPNTWIPTNIIPTPNTGPSSSTCLSQDLGNGPYSLSFDQTTLNAGESAYAFCHCWIRKNTSGNRSVIHLYITQSGDANANTTLDAIDANKGVIMAGIIDESPAGEIYLPVSFDNAADTEVWGFKLTSNELGTPAYPTSGSGVWMGDQFAIATGIAGEGYAPDINITDQWTVAGNTLFGVVALYEVHFTGSPAYDRVTSSEYFCSGGTKTDKQYWGRSTKGAVITTNAPDVPAAWVNAAVTDAKNQLLAGRYTAAGYIYDVLNCDIIANPIVFSSIYKIKSLAEDPSATITSATWIYVPVFIGTYPTSNPYLSINGGQPIFNICAVAS